MFCDLICDLSITDFTEIIYMLFCHSFIDVSFLSDGGAYKT